MEEIRKKIREEFNQALEMKITNAMKWEASNERSGKDFYYHFLSGDSQRTPQEHLEFFLESVQYCNKAKDILEAGKKFTNDTPTLLKDSYPDIVINRTKGYRAEQSAIRLFNEIIAQSKDWAVRNSRDTELDKPIKGCGSKGLKRYAIIPKGSEKNLKFRFSESCCVVDIDYAFNNAIFVQRQAVIDHFLRYYYVELDSIEKLETIYDFFQIAFEEYDKYKQEFKMEFVKKMNILANMKRLFQCFVKAAGIEAKAEFKPDEHYDYYKHCDVIQLRFEVHQEEPRISIEHNFPIEFWNASQSQIQEVAQRFINISRCVSDNGFKKFIQEE